MAKQTPLYEHYALVGAKVVDFAGWSLPLYFQSQLEEHHAVRRNAGVFDVSHMLVTDIEGVDAEVFLRRLLANDVGDLVDGGALYSCMLDEQAGILDDVIVYRLHDSQYRIVSNAATRDKILEWVGFQAQKYTVALTEHTGMALLAVQGPVAREKVGAALTTRQREQALPLKRFTAVETDGWFIARTGYTGEDGVEVLLPAGQAVTLWNSLLQSGVAACGLGCRDTLRLEAGFALYGSDMDESTTPYESNLGWTVKLADLSRDFIGRTALVASQQAGDQRRLLALRLSGRAVPRSGYSVTFANGAIGVVTSGTFSPTLNCGIALARVTGPYSGDCGVVIRNNIVPAELVQLPFLSVKK